MPHLAVPRKGWENEHLAAFLLSQIAFVANPLTVADDIGSDFFCTLFKPVKQANTEMLFPLNSFAIQVKSTCKDLDATNKICYLTHLELPFFLGVIDRSEVSLSLYSGEYLPLMFSKHGKPQTLKLCPVDDADMEHSKPYICSDEKGCRLKLPFVAAIAARDGPETISQNSERMERLCRRMHANIATWKLDEYVFRLHRPNLVEIMAGPGSAQTFRDNFYWRLAEVFYNMMWILEAQPNEFSSAEFEMYERFYIDMRRSGIPLPNIVTNIYEKLKELIRNKTPV